MPTQAIPVDYDPFMLAPAGTVIDPNEKDPLLQKRNEILLQGQQLFQQQQNSQQQDTLGSLLATEQRGADGGSNR
jgi:hypothetical protein